MHFKNYLLLITTCLIFLTCSKKAQFVELSDPGFGVTLASIERDDAGVDIPVLLKSSDVIKGIQFTLTWNSSVGQVLKPSLTASNPNFTVSTSEGNRGEMKVLIFSLTGDLINTEDDTIMTIPVRIINAEASDFTLAFKDVIFAGPNAISYDIPVFHANLKINH